MNVIADSDYDSDNGSNYENRSEQKKQKIQKPKNPGDPPHFVHPPRAQFPAGNDPRRAKLDRARQLSVHDRMLLCGTKIFGSYRKSMELRCLTSWPISASDTRRRIVNHVALNDRPSFSPYVYPDTRDTPMTFAAEWSHSKIQTTSLSIPFCTELIIA